jgi:hypothetical protein
MSGFLCLVGCLYKELGFEPLILCSTLSKSRDVLTGYANHREICVTFFFKEERFRPKIKTLNLVGCLCKELGFESLTLGHILLKLKCKKATLMSGF